MSEEVQWLRRVAGHTINGVARDFPHRCPGVECAIARWLARKDERIVYENLKAVTKAKAS